MTGMGEYMSGMMGVVESGAGAMMRACEEANVRRRRRRRRRRGAVWDSMTVMQP